MMESFLVPLLSVSLFHFPVRQRVPLLFWMFLSFLPRVPICISHLPVLLFTFLFIQPVVERILFTVSILQLWNQQWNLCEQRGHKHCLCILGWKKQKKKHKKITEPALPVSLQSSVCCPGRKVILIHTKKHCKAAASKPRSPPAQTLKMSKFLRMMVWVPCVKAWSLGSHCWEVLWPAGGTAPGKAAGTVGLNSSYSSLLLALTWLGMWVALLYHTFPQHATVLQQGQRVLGWKFQYYASKSTFLFIYWFLWIYYYSYRELTQTHSKAHRIGLLSCSISESDPEQAWLDPSKPSGAALTHSHGTPWFSMFLSPIWGAYESPYLLPRFSSALVHPVYSCQDSISREIRVFWLSPSALKAGQYLRSLVKINYVN